MSDRKGERGTGFTSTSQNIGVAVEPNPSASNISASATTVKRIKAWADQRGRLFRFPDMDSVLCVFTREPIGEERSFVFLRFRSGNKKKARIVMCLASCELDKGRYEVLPIENGGFGTFKVAVGNMTSVDIPIDLSLYY